MIKVTLIIGSLLAVTIAAVINNKDSNIVEGCESETEIWGSKDGTKFYFCLGDNMALEQPCEPNTFFVKNATVSGCVPVSEVSDNCVYHAEVQPCEGAALKQPQPHLDPTQYYLCPSAGAQPIVMTCPVDKAFVKQEGYLGCFEWAEWRQIRGCN